MRQTTRNVIGSAAVAACMAISASASAISSGSGRRPSEAMFNAFKPMIDRQQVAFLIPRPDDSKTTRNKSAKGATPATGVMDPINLHRPQVEQFAQIGAGNSPNLRSTTPSGRGVGLIVHSDTGIQINPETSQDAPKEKSWFNTPGRVAGAFFFTVLVAIGSLAYLGTSHFNPGRRRQLRAAQHKQEDEQQKGESQ